MSCKMPSASAEGRSPSHLLAQATTHGSETCSTTQDHVLKYNGGRVCPNLVTTRSRGWRLLVIRKQNRGAMNPQLGCNLCESQAFYETTGQDIPTPNDIPMANRPDGRRSLVLCWLQPITIEVNELMRESGSIDKPLRNNALPCLMAFQTCDLKSVNIDTQNS